MATPGSLGPTVTHPLSRRCGDTSQSRRGCRRAMADPPVAIRSTPRRPADRPEGPGRVCRLPTCSWGRRAVMSEHGAPSPPARSLIGRAEDVTRVRAFVDGAAVDGDTLLLWGDAGIGKTALLDVAATYATEAGTRVARAAGAEFEADVSSALHQLLQPLLDGPHGLSPLHTRALGVAVGMADGPP